MSTSELFVWLHRRLIPPLQGAGNAVVALDSEDFVATPRPGHATHIRARLLGWQHGSVNDVLAPIREYSPTLRRIGDAFYVECVVPGTAPAKGRRRGDSATPLAALATAIIAASLVYAFSALWPE